MYVLWFALAILAGISFLVLEWYLADKMSKSIVQGEPVRLAGKKSTYLLAIAGLSFLATTGLYLGFSTFYHASTNGVCFSVGALVAVVNVLVTSGRLKYVKFSDDKP